MRIWPVLSAAYMGAVQMAMVIFGKGGSGILLYLPHIAGLIV